VVKLPSGGHFYKSKKKTVKVGYLTATDENIISNINPNKSIRESVILPLLRNKVYEPDLRPEDMLEGDVEALMIFLRNTSFGPEYSISVKDPATGKNFTTQVLLDELNIKKCELKPDDNGHIITTLPRSGNVVKLKFLTIKDFLEIEDIIDQYPAGRIPPTQTVRINKMIVSIDNNEDRGFISKFIESMPIMDSKHIKKIMMDNEPKLDLTKEVIAPSGERVVVDIAFGVEFFRPFF
jgi:hypothetical protein